MKQRRGVRQENLSLTKITEIGLNIPALPIRKKVVNELDVFLQSRDALFMNYKTKLKGLEELKKSILPKAFAGELTENEVAV